MLIFRRIRSYTFQEIARRIRMFVDFEHHMMNIVNDVNFKFRNVIDIIDSDSFFVVSAKRMKQTKQSNWFNQNLLNFSRFRTLTSMQKLKKTSYCFVWKKMHSSKLYRIREISQLQFVFEFFVFVVLKSSFMRKKKNDLLRNEIRFRTDFSTLKMTRILNTEKKFCKIEMMLFLSQKLKIKINLLNKQMWFQNIFKQKKWCEYRILKKNFVRRFLTFLMQNFENLILNLTSRQKTDADLLNKKLKNRKILDRKKWLQ